MDTGTFQTLSRIMDKIFCGSKEAYFRHLDQLLEEGEGSFIVTANPETLSTARSEDFAEILLDPRVSIVADGIGTIKMAACKGIHIKERTPGVDCVSHLLKSGSQKEKSIAVLGSKPEVLKAFLDKIACEFPGLRMIYACDGYQPDLAGKMNEIADLKPDILLAALGIPRQEKAIYAVLDRLPSTVAAGVGGSLDVLSGSKKRAPLFFRKFGLEWLYRIVREPKRLKRFWKHNLLFYMKWKKLCRREAKGKLN